MSAIRSGDPLRHVPLVLAGCSVLGVVAYLAVPMFACCVGHGNLIAEAAAELAFALTVSTVLHSGLIAAFVAEGRSRGIRALAALAMLPPSLLMGERARSTVVVPTNGVRSPEDLVWVLACAAFAFGWWRLSGFSLPPLYDVPSHEAAPFDHQGARG